ncbi:LysM peptidoglycan-binding domain-containing protein [Aerococcus sp. UMB10185]|nr:MULTISPECIES: LysM peptidoglycan-binding domain-containing protein [unclassified Aerococcus]MDK6232839.1 LysM peptidoglycan-binding domain-containing protein [Aerococcus sp. UMB10185]MDK6855729.1 LysM peptidoglycan-binding domain-containing protein [Aerococcus sp. UMB7533]MDK8502470.1 LysM peptidoglycan-binding domain-containing protein [Aerococcus sp. UMB1112A]
MKLTLNKAQLLKTGALICGSAAVVAAVSADLTETVSADQVAVTATSTRSNQFLNKVIPHATELAGQNDLYASVMIAQAVLESGWGSSSLSQAPYNNLFGIKGNYQGNSVVMNTLEDNGSGSYYGIRDGFRAYPSYRESLIDYVGLLKNGPSFNSNFYSGAWKSNTNSYRDATAWLTGRYATDTSYGPKLNNLIETYGLTAYDQGGSTASVKTQARQNLSQKKSTGKSYTVKPGDGLYTVARNLGTTVSALKAQYGLTSNLIHPGQVFSVGASTSNQKAQPASSSQATKQTNTPSTGKSYTVKPGDGLYTVAQNLGTTVSALKAQYGLTSNLIHPGQVFSVGASTSTQKNQPASSSQATKQTNTPSAGKSYTVKPGDGLYTVAQNLGTTVSALKAQYGLTSNLIHPGQVFSVGSANTGQASKPAPSQQTPKQASSQSTGKSYTVKPGDGLYTVARNLGTTVSALKAQYGLSSNLIHPGQVFSTSGGQTTAKQTTQSPATSRPVAPSSQTTPAAIGHKVQAGDTLWRIASANGMTVQELKALNGLTGANIYVGQELKLSQSPAKAAPASQAVTSQAAPAQASSQAQTPAQASVNAASPSQTSSSPAAAQSQAYTIQAGDNLYRISVNHGVGLNELLAANNLKQDSLILPGQSLTIPGK